jgi:hypothetical protein
LKKKNANKLTTIFEETHLNEFDETQRVFRESSGDVLGGKYFLAEEEVETMLDQYINSGLKDEQNSLQSLMTYLQIEDVSTAEGSPHESKENEEALELVMTLMAQNSKVNLRRDIPHIVNDESILNLQKEVLEYDRKIVYIQKELECKQEVDDRYAKTSANLEDLYFKIKTA